MARPSRTTAGSLKDELLQHPYRFEFFQAVRLLRLSRLRECGANKAQDLGANASPTHECVRLKGALSHQFPAVEVGELKDRGADAVPELTVTVMGLYGAMGVLPLHDTQRLIDSRRDPTSEAAFLDLFNHRILSLFYRAWTKYFLPVNYEQTFGRAPGDPPRAAEMDTVTRSLLSLAGVGLPALQDRTGIPDTTFAFFAGHFSRQPKAATSLSQMIRSIFKVPVRVTHFVGQWLQLDGANRSEMPTPERIYGQNCQLGSGFVLGDRVWDVGGKFRLTLGPMGYEQMLSFCPWGEKLKPLCQLTRSYVGPQLKFDVQLELRAEEIPPLELGSRRALGANSWLFSRRPTENSLDPVFRFPD